MSCIRYDCAMITFSLWGEVRVGGILEPALLLYVLIRQNGKKLWKNCNSLWSATGVTWCSLLILCFIFAFSVAGYSPWKLIHPDIQCVKWFRFLYSGVVCTWQWFWLARQLQSVFTIWNAKTLGIDMICLCTKGIKWLIQRLPDILSIQKKVWPQACLLCNV